MKYPWDRGCGSEAPEIGEWTMAVLDGYQLGCRFLVEAQPRVGRVIVSRMDRTGRVPVWSECLASAARGPDFLREVMEMASKWIAAAVVKKSKRTSLSGSADRTLFERRPALKDFMGELESAPGVGREPSVLMIAVSDEGVRVGLKDEDAGGWLWREAGTFEEALDAIEKALQGGSVKWSTPGGRSGKKRS